MGQGGVRWARPIEDGLYCYYGWRQSIGNDRKLVSGGGECYQVTARVTAGTTVELAGSNVVANFSIHLCADTPTLSVDIPIDPIQSAAGAGVVAVRFRVEVGQGQGAGQVRDVGAHRCPVRDDGVGILGSSELVGAGGL